MTNLPTLAYSCDNVVIRFAVKSGAIVGNALKAAAKCGGAVGVSWK